MGFEANNQYTFDTLEERFREKFVCDGPGLCWNWIGGTMCDQGYGAFWMDGRMRLAHRVAYTLFVGPIPEAKVVMHLCHNVRCVNPKHLALGGQVENVRASARRLTMHKANAIRAALTKGMSISSLAKEFGVCKATISHVKNGRTWISL